PSDTSPSLLFLYCAAAHRALHSFPTRRSSDLNAKHSLHPHPGPPRPLGRRWWTLTGSAWLPWRWWRRTIRTVFRLRVSDEPAAEDRKSTRLNSSHVAISYAVFCLKKKKNYVKV